MNQETPGNYFNPKNEGDINLKQVTFSEKQQAAQKLDEAKKNGNENEIKNAQNELDKLYVVGFQADAIDKVRERAHRMAQEAGKSVNDTTANDPTPSPIPSTSQTPVDTEVKADEVVNVASVSKADPNPVTLVPSMSGTSTVTTPDIPKVSVVNETQPETVNTPVLETSIPAAVSSTETTEESQTPAINPNDDEGVTYDLNGAKFDFKSVQSDIEQIKARLNNDLNINNRPASEPVNQPLREEMAKRVAKARSINNKEKLTGESALEPAEINSKPNTNWEPLANDLATKVAKAKEINQQDSARNAEYFAPVPKKGFGTRLKEFFFGKKKEDVPPPDEEVYVSPTPQTETVASLAEAERINAGHRSAVESVREVQKSFREDSLNQSNSEADPFRIPTLTDRIDLDGAASNAESYAYLAISPAFRENNEVFDKFAITPAEEWVKELKRLRLSTDDLERLVDRAHVEEDRLEQLKKDGNSEFKREDIDRSIKELRNYYKPMLDILYPDVLPEALVEEFKKKDNIFARLLDLDETFWSVELKRNVLDEVTISRLLKSAMEEKTRISLIDSEGKDENGKKFKKEDLLKYRDKLDVYVNELQSTNPVKFN
jgi:hypothetical protein